MNENRMLEDVKRFGMVRVQDRNRRTVEDEFRKID